MVASLRVLARKKRMRLVFTKGRYHGGQQEKKKFMQLVERWETPSWERNISEHGIIQETQITT